MKLDQRITFITLGVKNLQASIDFYENCFGWRRSDMSSDNMVLFALNGIHLALYPSEELAEDALVSPEGEGFKGFTLAHNVWSEAEVDNVIENLRRKGVRVVKEPQKVFWGGYSSYIADPDGFLWEIAYNPFLEKG
ncbi:MAG TPA: glyoxalase [Prolixibacteraceae bacterium]|nr:glyoxalase [Prolixibacteraceae bacterium]